MTKRNRRNVQDARVEKKLNQGSRQEVQAQKFQEERRAKIKPLTAQSDNQKIALHNLHTKQLNLLVGSAGTGKTELMCWYAAKLWLEGEVDTIIITRPNKALGQDPGATPGGDTQKILAYVMSMLFKFKKYLGVNVLKNSLKMELAELLFNDTSGIYVYPIEKLQGMSFNSKTIVLADEIQSSSIAQVKSLVTRMESGAKLMISGDTTQSALSGVNGLSYLIEKTKQYSHPDVGMVVFTPDDNCRKGISAHYTRIFEKEGQW